MSCSGMVSRTFEFLRGFGAAEKIQAKAYELLRKFDELLRKIKKKLKLTALASQQLFGSHSVEMFCFEFETIYVKTSRNMSNPMKIQLSFFG